MKKITVCRLCSACCPVEVEIKNSEFIKAERLSFFPENKRLKCKKLEAARDIIYSPLRVKTPLIRVKNKWEEISWDEALNKISEKFFEIKEEFGAEYVCWLRGMAADWGIQWDYVNRLMNAWGSPNSIGNGSVCHVAREMAHTYTYGAMTIPDIKNSKLIVIWGKNDFNTCLPAAESILYAKSKGAKIITIDPVKTKAAEIADIWLQIKSGCDGLLAMSMINEIISNNLYDKDFVENYTTGFYRLKEVANKFSAESVADKLWLTPSQIKEFSHLYATTKPACIIDGNGIDMQINVFQISRAISFLRAITGNLDIKGGDLIPQPLPIKNIQLKERLNEKIKPVTYKYKLFDEFNPTWGRHAQSALIDSIINEDPYPIKMLIVQSGNPAVTMTESAKVREAFKKLDFIVVIDLFKNKTSEYADIFLPAASCFEETQLNRAYFKNNFIMLQNQVIKPLGESLPDTMIIFKLARYLGLHREFPWETPEDALDFILEPLNIATEELKNNPSGIITEEFQYKKYLNKGFNTPSKKVEIFSEKLEQHGYEPIPYIFSTPEDDFFAHDNNKKFDFIGLSGDRVNWFTHTQFRQIPKLRKIEKEGTIKINYIDAKEKNIKDNELLKVTTKKGSVIMKAEISDKVHKGSVQISWGWGEVSDEFNVNNLTDDSVRDPVTGTPSNRTFLCKIEKI
jgi:anaerobic selenocysteine-containing dehydrogenase